jgi:hypothetical protein
MNNTKYAFVLIHFGNNVKYLEYEIYVVLMLKSISTYDIIYLYSKSDTPNTFLEIMINFNVKPVPYDDGLIIEKMKNFKSMYEHFNTLKTCASMFAYLLTDYEKVCVVESDMIFVKGFEDVFEFKCPAMLYFKKDYLFKNAEIKLDKDELLKVCNTKSFSNGGIMLFKPSIKTFNTFLNNLDKIIINNCVFPNETLFLISNKKHYNLPMNFNMVHYYLTTHKVDKIFNYHFNSTIYKPLDIIRDNYLDKLKKKEKEKYDIILFFKNNYYNKFHNMIESILEKLVKIEKNTN